MEQKSQKQYLYNRVETLLLIELSLPNGNSSFEGCLQSFPKLLNADFLKIMSRITQLLLNAKFDFK